MALVAALTMPAYIIKRQGSLPRLYKKNKGLVSWAGRSWGRD